MLFLLVIEVLFLLFTNPLIFLKISEIIVKQILIPVCRHGWYYFVLVFYELCYFDHCSHA